MTLEALKEQIEHLPEQQQHDLLRWLDERDRTQWDAEMERDFAPDGAAAFLLEEAMADFEAGRFEPLDEVLAGVRSKRGDPSGRKTRA
jgi:hypothetical protein